MKQRSRALILVLGQQLRVLEPLQGLFVFFDLEELPGIAEDYRKVLLGLGRSCGKKQEKPTSQDRGYVT